MVKLTLFLIAGLLLPLFGVAIEVVTPLELAGTSLNAPELRCLNNPPPATGPLVVWSLLDFNNPNFNIEEKINGSVILMPNLLAGNGGSLKNIGYHGPVEERWFLDWFKNKGAKAIILISTSSEYGGGSEHLVDSFQWCYELSPMVVVECGIRQGANLTSWYNSYGEGNVTLTVSSGGVNLWRYMRLGWYMTIFSIFFSLVAAAICSLAFAKIISYVRAQGLQLTIPLTVLIINFIVNLYRLCYVAIDPVYSGRWFNGYAAQAQSTITWPFPIVTTLLLSFYMKELMDKLKMKAASMGVGKFLSRLKIPFIVISVILIALECVVSSLRAVRVATLAALTYVESIINVVVGVSMAVFFFYTGSQIVRAQAKGRSIQVGGKLTRRQLASQAAVAMIIAGAFLVLWCVGIIMLAIPPIFWHPIGHYICWGIIWGGLFGVSAAQVAAFNWAGSKVTQSKTSHSRTTDSKFTKDTPHDEL